MPEQERLLQEVAMRRSEGGPASLVARFLNPRMDCHDERHRDCFVVSVGLP
jgi:hypothetical protein